MVIVTSEGEEQKLTAVEVAGFKSAMSPVRLDFRDVTILAGANSTGKSSIMQPLLLIKQTIEKPFDPGGIAIDGPLVRFTQADQFFSYAKSKVGNPTFSVTTVQAGKRIRLSYGRSISGSIGIIGMAFSQNGKEHSWIEGQLLEANDASLTNPTGGGWTGGGWYSPAMLDLAGDGMEIRVSRDRAVLAARIVPRDGSRAPIVSLILSPASAMVSEVQKIIYLPGLRGNPERYYVISASGPQFPGSFNDYVASIIHRWGATKDDRIKLLEDNLRLLGLTSRVTTEAIDDTRVEVRVGRLPVAARSNTRDTVNIADVGFGVSQTLPVLVALLAAAPGQIVFIEQPELHLHPRAQVRLAEIILQAADRGVRAIVETHSSLLILALQALIAEGKVAPDRVSLNWFTRDKTGQTHVAEADLAKDGSYGDWPVDFDDVEADLQNRYLNLVDRLRAEG